MSSPVWFITGASHGLGLILTLRVLKGGHRVTGSMRNKEKHANAVKQIKDAGGEVTELDLTESQESIHEKIRAIGHIDFLVNNAGYSICEKEVHALFSANMFGPVYVMQAALENVRTRRLGLIINVSSNNARDPFPASAMYAATKAALEAASEGLQKEVEPFGIKVLIVQLGSFRTNFMRGIQRSTNPLPDDYKNTFEGYHNRQPGDPERAAYRMFEIATGEGMAGELKDKVLRLALGGDGHQRMKQNTEKFVHDMTIGEKVAYSTDYSNASNEEKPEAHETVDSRLRQFIVTRGI
ncbi:putative short-chain dehydrogenase [Xylariaceae sp. FL1272]|nr:putative short-chain dehydrogenase [Xylariaceae sp. FL1272]